MKIGWWPLLASILVLGGSALAAAGEDPRHASKKPPNVVEPELDGAAAKSPAAKAKDSHELRELRRWVAAQMKKGELPKAEGDRILKMLVRLRAAKNKLSRSESERQLIEALKDILRDKVVRDKTSREARESLAMFYLFLEEPDKALVHLRKAGPASELDFYYPLRLAYTQLRLGVYQKGAAYLKQVERLLAARTPLRLSTPAFCSSIVSYRIYTPHAGAFLRPGEIVLVYIEITGVALRQNAGGASSCSLSFDLAIKDSFQRPLWSKPEYGSWNRTYQGPVRDMHVSITLRIPSQIPLGRHHLTVTCRDNFGDKDNSTSTVSIGFNVGQKGKAAGGAKPATATSNPGPSGQSH